MFRLLEKINKRRNIKNLYFCRKKVGKCFYFLSLTSNFSFVYFVNCALSSASRYVSARSLYSAVVGRRCAPPVGKQRRQLSVVFRSWTNTNRKRPLSRVLLALPVTPPPVPSHPHPPSPPCTTAQDEDDSDASHDSMTMTCDDDL